MAQLEGLVVTGDLILLTPEERIQFYIQVCKANGLDPLTRPLQYFEQVDRNGKRVLILYALRAASAQLSRTHKLSSSVVQSSDYGTDLATFKAHVSDPDGRFEEAVGSMSLVGLKGKELADAIMTAQTKAKRRAVLDFCGCALLDESEVEGMNGRPVEITEEALKGFVPVPAAPQANAASATEVVAIQPAGTVIEPMPPIPAPATSPSVVPPRDFYGQPTAAEINAATARLQELSRAVEAAKANEPPPPPLFDPKVKEAAEKREMDQIFARLSTYRRDVLQRGGMKPSKGFGIQAKWEKFLRKHAPDKTLEQYQTLLIALDLCLKQTGESGVVVKIEQEII